MTPVMKLKKKFKFYLILALSAGTLTFFLDKKYIYLINREKVNEVYNKREDSQTGGFSKLILKNWNVCT